MIILRQTLHLDDMPISHGTNGSSTFRGGESPWCITQKPVYLLLEYFPQGWKFTRNGEAEPIDWRLAHNLLDTYTGLTPAGKWLEKKLWRWQDSYRENSTEILELKSEFESLFWQS